jgi:hypothetical protein
LPQAVALAPRRIDAKGLGCGAGQVGHVKMVGGWPAIRSYVGVSTAGKSPRVFSTGGIGLGLTIARHVARSRGGDVRLETPPYVGLRAGMHLRWLGPNK